MESRPVPGDWTDAYRSRIGQLLGVPPELVALFARGRVAFYALLTALGVGPGDEVIVPAFTCVAVPNAILYTGARPVWVDIDPATYTIDPAAAQAAVSTRTRVLLAQNTFGLSADLRALEGVAERQGLVLIDDSTHGLGGRYRGRPNGSSAPFSFFSTQWSKPISTGLGGFAVAQDETVAPRLRDIEAAARRPSKGSVTVLRALLTARELAGGGPILRIGRAAYRRLSRLGALPGSSSRDELEDSAMPGGFLSRLSQWQAQLGYVRIQQLPAVISARRSIAHRYAEWLSARGLHAASESPDSEHAFLRYPLRVADRATFIAAAEHAGVDLGDWFVSPIHPMRDALDRWGYVTGSAPRAEHACREIVNLPTDPQLGERGVQRVLAFLADNAGSIR